LERLLEDASFSAAEPARAELVIDGAYVDRQLSELAKDDDLSRFIL
jgi:ATP-dependent HslUV protease ATP-binding subunit HslU